MINFYKITKKSNGKQIIVMTEYTLEQVQAYYRNIQLQVDVVRQSNPTKEEVLHACSL